MDSFANRCVGVCVGRLGCFAHAADPYFWRRWWRSRRRRRREEEEATRAHARTRATSAFSSDRRSRALLRETRKGLPTVSHNVAELSTQSGSIGSWRDSDSEGVCSIVTSEKRTTNNQQPTTNNQQRTTNNQEPTTNNQQPTTTNHPPTTTNQQQQPPPPPPLATLIPRSMRFLSASGKHTGR